MLPRPDTVQYRTVKVSKEKLDLKGHKVKLDLKGHRVNKGSKVILA